MRIVRVETYGCYCYHLSQNSGLFSGYVGQAEFEACCGGHLIIEERIPQTCFI